MIKRKYVVLLMVTLVSIPLAGLLYSNLVQALTTVTGYVSVPAAAFQPNYYSIPYSVDAELRNLDIGPVIFYAPVQLPHGATLNLFTCYWYDIGASDMQIVLFRYNMSFWDIMAFTLSYGNAGNGKSFNNTIAHATVDNSLYAYEMWVTIPSSPDGLDYRFRYAFIVYTLPSGAVGGLYIPVDKFTLLAPYIALVSTIILAVSISVAYIKYRKKQ